MNFSSRAIAVAVMLLAAICEVGGDAMIRSGLRGRGWLLLAAGAVTLAAYGVIVNVLEIDFSKLLATYVAFFAIVSVLFGRVVFRDAVPATTWIGLSIILIGSAVVQVST
jgi:small multidrug resistance family-3 protein